jgi:hypothetical protein
MKVKMRQWVAMLRFLRSVHGPDASWWKVAGR